MFEPLNSPEAGPGPDPSTPTPRQEVERQEHPWQLEASQPGLCHKEQQRGHVSNKEEGED